jgi:superfamily I DNA and/or RNA helicase
VVLAGDHLQLPPIVQGVYPEPLPGQPVLHRSIFEVVADARTVNKRDRSVPPGVHPSVS